MDSGFRIGVLTNPVLLHWQEVALRNVAEMDGVSIEHVVVDASVREESSTFRQGVRAIDREGLLSLADLRLFYDVLREEKLKALLYADQKLGWELVGDDRGRRWIQSRPVESVELLSEARIHDCEPIPAGGNWKTLPEHLTETLGGECDVLFLFGFGLLKGPVLDAPEYGVLGTHGSDIREYRGMGSKMAFLSGDRSATVTLQRITERIDGGEIVAVSSKSLSEYPTYSDFYVAIKEIQTEIFATGIRKLRDPSFEPREPDELGTYYSHGKMETDVGFAARFLAKNNWRRFRQRLSPKARPVPSLR